MVSEMEKILTELAHDRDLLRRLRQQGMSYARECLTWDAKARRTTRVLQLGFATRSETRTYAVNDAAETASEADL